MSDSVRPALAVGQAWSFKGAPAPTARAVIGAIDVSGGVDVIHLAIVDLPSPKELARERDVISITHMPFDRACVEASVETLLGEECPPESFAQGRANWRDAEARGEAQVFEMLLSDIIDSVYGDDERASQLETVH